MKLLIIYTDPEKIESLKIFVEKALKRYFLLSKIDEIQCYVGTRLRIEVTGDIGRYSHGQLQKLNGELYELEHNITQAFCNEVRTTIEHIANILHISPRHVQRLCKKGVIPAHKNDGRWQISSDDFKDYLNIFFKKNY